MKLLFLHCPLNSAYRTEPTFVKYKKIIFCFTVIPYLTKKTTDCSLKKCFRPFLLLDLCILFTMIVTSFFRICVVTCYVRRGGERKKNYENVKINVLFTLRNLVFTAVHVPVLLAPPPTLLRPRRRNLIISLRPPAAAPAPPRRRDLKTVMATTTVATPRPRRQAPATQPGPPRLPAAPPPAAAASMQSSWEVGGRRSSESRKASSGPPVPSSRKRASTRNRSPDSSCVKRKSF